MGRAITMAAAAGLAMLLGAGAAGAEEPAGDWLGVLSTQVGELRLAVHLKRDAAGGYQGTLDSLDQGVRGMAVSAVSATADRLSFEVPAVHARYAGAWTAAEQDWTGTWSQGQSALPLKLKRGLAPPAPMVEGLDGDWDGTLDINGARLRLAFHIHTTPATGTVATFDSIDQNVAGVGIPGVARTGDQVSLAVTAFGVRFEGKLSPDGASIAGHWRQGPLDVPLTLTRRAAGSAQAVARRPQTPVGPFPYRSEAVAFDNPAAPGHVRLAGTLTLPPGPGPFPTAVLIAGSGPQGRDEDIFGHKLFLVLADHLTLQGVAVLRFDKRGVGQSTGDYAAATTPDFASDVKAALAYLRTRKDIDPRRTGLVGHSEGGLIAPMVAADDRRVAFVVLMAAPGESGLDIILQQGHLISRAMGMNRQTTGEGDALRAQVFHALEDKDPAQAAAEARRLLTAYGKAHGASDTMLNAQLKMLTSDWFRTFLAYDPRPALRRLRCPVLAIAGSKDLQVPPEENLAAIRTALTGDRDVTVTELPGLNHLFQPAQTGSPMEYASIETTLSPLALDTMTDWITRRTAAAN